MTKSMFVAALSGLISTAFVAAPSFAKTTTATVAGKNVIKAYICGNAETADAASTYTNVSNLLCNELATLANAEDSAGLTLTNTNNAENGFGANSITFDLWGTPNPNNGPFVIVTDTNGNTYVSDLSTAKKIRALPNQGVQYNMQYTSFASSDPAPVATTKISTISFQINPGSTQFSVAIGGVHLNTAQAKQVTSKATDLPICPE